MVVQILVIEDQPDLLKTLATFLTLENYTVLTASGGVEGLRLAREHLPDLIICDVVMPQLDGYEVLAALRSDPTTQAIPFIFLTGKHDRQDRRHGMTLGANDYITKPFSVDEVVNAIEARLARQHSIQNEFEQQIKQLRQMLVFALPLELRSPLADILCRADQLQHHAHAMITHEIHETARALFDAATMLQRQIENYLIFSQLEILHYDPERVIVRRERCTEDPAKVIGEAARRVTRTHQRSSDLVLEVSGANAGVAADSLYKVIEELVGYNLITSSTGTEILVRATATDNAYTITVTTPGITLPADVISALRPAEQTVPALRVLRAPALGIIVAQHLVMVQDGRLTWQHSAEDGLQWTVAFEICS